ncbi:MAG: hypothetical protein IJ879_04855, partial [Muribaculaceae bacterium]|nr:hypothetical protein [Muribaculaceae bacterium]
KQHQEAAIRRYKMAVVVAFLAGIVSGIIAMTYILSTPMDVPVFTFKNQYFLLQWLSENSRFITATAISLLMTVGITSFFGNIQELMSMRHSLHNQRTGM